MLFYRYPCRYGDKELNLPLFSRILRYGSADINKSEVFHIAYASGTLI